MDLRDKQNVELDTVLESEAVEVHRLIRKGVEKIPDRNFKVVLIRILSLEDGSYLET